MKYKIKSKVFSVLIAIILIIAALPLSTMAAPAADIPAEMLNNAFLDALAYTGYNVGQQKNDGTIFVKYSNNAPASVRSGIGYGTACSGLETSAGKPDIARFRSSGLCCASYVSYVYYNYLPNVAHIDTSQFPCPSNPRSAAAYNEAANTWVNSGKAHRITFAQSTNGSNFTASESIPIGSLIVFKSISSGAVAHVAAYMGYYNGQHFVSHVGSDNGPELCTIEGMSKGGSPEAVAQIVTPEIIGQDGKIEVKKTDPNGNGLSGAQFSAISQATGIEYRIGPTDANGYAVSVESMPYGTYAVRETVFPQNYISSGQSEWTVTIDASNNGIVRINAVNAQKTGTVEVAKFAEDGVKEGFVFRLTGTSVYGEQINLSATTNSYGIAVFGNVPIGNNYTISEANTPIQYIAPQSKSVSVRYGETSNVEFNNFLKKSSIKIIKKDSQTGNIIPISGIGFKVRNCETNTYISEDIFYTDETGSLMLPEKLAYGDYEIIEQSAPNGYVPDKTPVAFTVDGTEETVTVIKKNNPQKGIIEIHKTGEVFSSVKEENGLFVPVYSEKGLKDAKLEIRAAEDIYTPDGTLRYAKDTLADTVVTDSDGNAVSIPLYLGKYIVAESEAPFGMALCKTPQIAELTYAGQTAQVTATSVSILNERQKARISLLKELEQNEIFKLGGSELFKNVVFGLYASDKITAADGTYIPADGLIETVRCNQNGEIVFTADVPLGIYYVKEISNDSHYIPDDTKYPVEFYYTGQETETVIIPVNDGLPIKNSLLYGSVTTTKIDRDYPDNKLTGAIFEIYADVNGNGIFEEGTDVLVGQMSETETGLYSFENLVCGGYFLYEKTAPIGYIRDREYHCFEITDESTVTVSNNGGTGFCNKPIHSTVFTSPKTGDNTRTLLYSIVLLLSGFSLAAIIKIKKQERN